MIILIFMEYPNSPSPQFSIRWLSTLHLSKWVWGKWYYWLSKACFLHWPAHCNRQRRKIKNSAINVMTFPIVNFPFISSNNPKSQAYEVYISQLIRYYRACAQYIDFLDMLLTWKLVKQDYFALMLKSFPTKILRWSSRSGWPLRNIHTSNDNGSFTLCLQLFVDGSISYLRYVYMFVHSGVQHLLWCVWFFFSSFFFFFSRLHLLSCVSNVACFSGLFILDCVFGFL